MDTLAKSLVAAGKGILAADESFSTIEKRFKSINTPSTEGSRRAYREMLFSTPDLNRYISGVILFDETLRQKTAQGIPFPQLLQRQGIIPGIKVDKGAKPLAFHPGEKVTEGLDGLRERFAEYRELGARFSKWRAVIGIAENLPSRFCLEANADALARFAALSQEAGLVPIVEPEVLMDGGHDLARCEEVTSAALDLVFHTLASHRIRFEEMLLKPNMVVPGKDCPRRATPDEIAEATRRTLLRFVPAAVPGIVFLSGGQSDVEATQNLNAINLAGPAPWALSFSFGRALQAPPLQVWAGQESQVPAAQKALFHRARGNYEARFGRYSEAIEQRAD